MKKEDNAVGERMGLKDLLSGRAIRGLGAMNRVPASSERGRVRVYDPEVKFISLSNSLHLRGLSGGQAK